MSGLQVGANIGGGSQMSCILEPRWWSTNRSSTTISADSGPPTSVGESGSRTGQYVYSLTARVSCVRAAAN